LFINRSGNQLVLYSLPSQAGFPFITRNFPALVQNSGFEFELNTQNIKAKNFSWTTFFNISFPRNKLISFPVIELSSYASVYVEGVPLDVIFKYNCLGVNPLTGAFHFEVVNRDGGIFTGYGQDFVVTGGNLIKYFGGVRNEMNYKSFSLSFLFE